MPPAGAGAQPGGPQPPPGSGTSPATMPVGNEGIKAAAITRVANIASMLHLLAAAFGPGSDEAREITSAIRLLEKVARPSSQSPGLMSADMQKMAAQSRANQQNAASMMQRGGGGGAPAGPPAAPPMAA